MSDLRKENPDRESNMRKLYVQITVTGKVKGRSQTAGRYCGNFSNNSRDRCEYTECNGKYLEDIRKAKEEE